MGAADVLRRAVFLDRDGVLNETVRRSGRPYPPANAAELRICAGAEAACAALHDAGFLLIGATNQPDVSRGRTSLATVTAINDVLVDRLGLQEIRVCPHDDGEDCGCRKPKPGLLTTAARDFDIDLGSSIMVGDRWKDVAAGDAAGCRTVFIDRGYDEAQPASPGLTCRELVDAVQWIIEGKQDRR